MNLEKRKELREDVEKIYVPLKNNLERLLGKNPDTGLNSITLFWSKLKEGADNKRIRSELGVEEYCGKVLKFESKLPILRYGDRFVPNLEEKTESVIEEIKEYYGSEWLKKNEDKLEELISELRNLWRELVKDGKKLLDKLDKVIIEGKKVNY